MSARAGSGFARTVLVFWLLLLFVAGVYGSQLDQVWPGWVLGFSALAIWGLNALVLRFGIGPPFTITRIPLLAAAFGLGMTVLGTGSYWATTLIFPNYRVDIERAMVFVAVCTLVTMATTAVALRLRERQERVRSPSLVWDWERLRLATYLIFVLAFVGTVVTLRRIGYIPAFAGDPDFVRFDFPAIGGIWYRLSMLGGVAALLAAALAAGRQAGVGVYGAGFISLLLVGAYGPRFFVALPVGVALLLWQQTRGSLRVGRIVIVTLIALPVVVLAGYWRQGFPTEGVLGPIGLVLYGTFLEFRDLAWALDYFQLGDRFVHGATLASIIVPLMPTPAWSLLGIDKAALYAQDSANLIANAMGQSVPQRIGAYGEFFMNFGWPGAIGGAGLYGLLLAHLDRGFRYARAHEVRSVFLALAAAVAVFAQIGQLNMFTSTLTGLGYPMLLVAMAASRRSSG